VVDGRRRARHLATQFLGRGDPTGWFEPLYASAVGDPTAIPWADRRPNPHLVAWLDQPRTIREGRRALVVGCGLGDDAEEVVRRGWIVDAFDVAPTAVAWCRRRFPASPVAYQVGNLLDPPATWSHAFDLIVEVYTLQALPPAPRSTALRNLAAFVAPGGTLLIIARGRERDDDPGVMPWPLTKEEIGAATDYGLVETAFTDIIDDEQPPVRRFRVTYRRPSSPPLPFI